MLLLDSDSDAGVDGILFSRGRSFGCLGKRKSGNMESVCLCRCIKCEDAKTEKMWKETGLMNRILARHIYGSQGLGNVNSA